MIYQNYLVSKVAHDSTTDTSNPQVAYMLH